MVTSDVEIAHYRLTAETIGLRSKINHMVVMAMSNNDNDNDNGAVIMNDNAKLIIFDSY